MRKNCNSYISLRFLNSILTYKRFINHNNSYLIRYPVYSKNVVSFETQGTVIKLKNKDDSCNQTVTISTSISNVKTFYCFHLQCKAISFR